MVSQYYRTVCRGRQSKKLMKMLKKSKKEFINLDKIKYLTLQFNSNIMTGITDQGRTKIERVAVIINYPGTPDAQLIRIIPVDNDKASTQAKATQEILEKYELFDMVEFLSFDTTDTNT